MIRAVLWIFGAVLLGGIVHLSTVLAMPQAATQDAYSRLVPLAPVNTMVPLAAPTAEIRSCRSWIRLLPRRCAATI